MKLTIDMPTVSACAVNNCAYNANGNCHARAITIGDQAHPMCDTYLGSTAHIHDTARIAGVGACKVSACQHNNDFECQAHAIQVGFHGNHADCITYKPR